MLKRIKLSRRALSVLNCIVPEYGRALDNADAIARRLELPKAQVMRTLASLNKKSLIRMEWDGSLVEPRACLINAPKYYNPAFGLAEVRTA